jgi:tetratricopeptide (TPR) repeat protein
MTDHLIQRRPPPTSQLLAARGEIPEDADHAYRGDVKRYLLDHEGPQTTDDLYDALAQVIDSANLEAGIPRLKELIQSQHPGQPNFSIELGDAMRHGGDLSGAIEAYRQAVALDPLSSRGQRRLGATLGIAGKPDEALTVLGKAIEHEPDNPLLWYEQALVESSLGRSDKAIADLRKAIQLKPDFADAQNNLGTNLAQTGDHQGAETAFRAALIINPYDAGTQANLGRLLAGKSDWKQSAFHLAKAVQLDPSDLNAHLAYSVVLLQMNRLPDAEKEAQAAVKIDPGSPQANDLLRQILALKGDKR